MATKYYHIYGQAVDSKGENHIVTVVGKFVQKRKKREVNEEVDVETFKGDFIKGKLTYDVKQLNRKLTLGMSICHPSDDFDEEIGVEVAKRRIKQGQDLGTIETNNVTMLTEDAILAELMVKLNHIIENIDEFLS